MSNKFAFWCGILGVGFFTFATILGGIFISGYSHISQLISETYTIETTYGKQLRFFGIIPSGILLAVFSFLALRTLAYSVKEKIGFAGLGIFYGLATIVVGIFPCEAGCNQELINPGLSQLIHNITGFLTYLIAPICPVILGVAALKWENAKHLAVLGILCGINAFIFVWVLSFNLQSPFAGLYQRIIEGSILVWILVCSIYLRTFKKEY